MVSPVAVEPESASPTCVCRKIDPTPGYCLYRQDTR